MWGVRVVLAYRSVALFMALPSSSAAEEAGPAEPGSPAGRPSTSPARASTSYPYKSDKWLHVLAPTAEMLDGVAEALRLVEAPSSREPEGTSNLLHELGGALTHEINSPLRKKPRLLLARSKAAATPQNSEPPACSPQIHRPTDIVILRKPTDRRPSYRSGNRQPGRGGGRGPSAGHGGAGRAAARGGGGRAVLKRPAAAPAAVCTAIVPFGHASGPSSALISYAPPASSPGRIWIRSLFPSRLYHCRSAAGKDAWHLVFHAPPGHITNFRVSDGWCMMHCDLSEFLGGPAGPPPNDGGEDVGDRVNQNCADVSD